MIRGLGCVFRFTALWLCIVSGRGALGAIALSDLLASHGSMIVGDSLRFDNFSYTPTGMAPGASAIKVDSITDAAGNLGLRFVGGFSDTTADSFSSGYFTYRVTPTNISRGITAVGLAGNPTVVGLGSSVVAESFALLPTQLRIFDERPGSSDLQDSQRLPSVMSELHVQLAIVNDASDGFATVSFVDTTFGQSDQVVPEPQSLAIWIGTLLLGGVMLVLHRHPILAPTRAARSKTAR